MAPIANEKLDSIKREVDDLHPLLESLLSKLPRVNDVEYCHGVDEMGADFVVTRTDDVLGDTEYIGVIAKLGKIVQNLTEIERQIEECRVPRLVQNGKKKIRLTEIWIVATKHITNGAKTKIYSKYSDRAIKFINGSQLEKLVDKYTPLAWNDLPIIVGEYLRDLQLRTVEQDKRVSILQLSDEAVYVKQDLYHIPDIEYRYKPKHHHKQEKVEVEDVHRLHRCVLIEGGVGSGKSKLLRQIITKATEPEAFSESRLIPLIGGYTELMGEHSGNLRTFVESRVPAEVRERCPDSEYLILIDAFDERRTEVDLQADELNAIFHQASTELRFRVIVTSRFLKGVERGGVLQSDVARCELHALSMQRTFEFISKICAKINVKDRILEDLKRSTLFRSMPRSPMSAILLARLLNENQHDIPSNMTELYSKYSELILGRWDERKGLQSQKEYQALDNILMRVARQMIESGRQFVPVSEVREVFKVYLGDRNLEIDPDSLFHKMVDRCEVLFFDSDSRSLGFKHRSFTEFFYARSLVLDQAFEIDQRAFNVYWTNTIFFYLGLRRDCPEDLRRIFDLHDLSEAEQWMKIINMSNYLLAAYTTPYEIIEEGVFNVAQTAARLYRTIVEEGSQLWFKYLSRMHLLCLLQMFVREGYSYKFFARAIEDAALRIDDSTLDNETKAYALFFLNVAYIDIEGIEEGQTFDFMLERIHDALPIELQLALVHEGKKKKDRTKLMRKQERNLRRVLPTGDVRRSFMEALYDRPLSDAVKKPAKLEEKENSRKDAGKR